MDGRAILHVDMDAFYASVEQLDNPALRGKPLIVGGTSGRGVVAAASYEVRRFGVRSAMPIGRALQLCPEAICVRPRMARYKEVSRQVFSILQQFTPLVEGLSLDEAFLDVTGSRALHGDAVSIAHILKQRIFDETGLRASVGVAPNKLVAKIASDLDKPDGLTVITTESLPDALDPLPIRRLPGLGRKKGDAVIAAGITTLGALRSAPEAALRGLFGRDSRRMRERAAGIDSRPVIADSAEKSISAEETFAADLSGAAPLRAELLPLADRVATRLRARGLTTTCISIKIRRHDFATFTRQRTFSPATDDSQHIAALACRLLDAWLRDAPQARLRLLGVGASELSPSAQPDLFDAAPQPGTQRLDATIDSIRHRFGSGSLSRASSLAGRAKRPFTA